MAGPIPTFVSTQLATQAAFTDSFGLLSLVNSSIATAVAAGEFNVTIDCSLFNSVNVSTLGIYLNSQGYKVDYNKREYYKTLRIDWSLFEIGAANVLQGSFPWIVDGSATVQPVSGTITTIPSGVQAVSQSGIWTVNLATEPTIQIGKVDQGAPGILPWPVSGTFTFTPSLTATTLAESVTSSSAVLLGTNTNRKGFAVQNTSQIVFIKLDSTCSTDLYSYELPKKGILEIENYCGPVSAVTASGTVIVMVTEKV
jgi:hypothetical protein